MKNLFVITLCLISTLAFSQKTRPEKKIVVDSFYLSIKIDEELGDTVFYENRDITYSSGEKTQASQFAGPNGEAINYRDTLKLLGYYGVVYMESYNRVAEALRNFYISSEALRLPRDLNRSTRSVNIIPVQSFVEQNLINLYVDQPNFPPTYDTVQTVQTVYDSLSNTSKDTVITTVTEIPSTSNLSPGTRYRLKQGAAAFVNCTMHINRNNVPVIRLSGTNVPVNIHSQRCISISINNVWYMLFNIESNIYESLDRSVKLQKI